MYNYYAGVTNASACSESPSTWPTGTNNNGDVAGYYYNDIVNSGLSHTATYTYDGVNRLTTAAATGSSTYSQTFSLSTRTETWPAAASPSEVNCLAPTYSATNNQITTSVTPTTCAGNVTGDGTYTYQWDAERRTSPRSFNSGNDDFHQHL